MDRFLPIGAGVLMVALIIGGVWYAVTHPPIRAGYIVEKDYHPERNWTTMERREIGGHEFYSTRHHHRDEYWTVTVEDRGRQTTWHVGHQRWEQCMVGLWFDYDTQVLLSIRPGPSQAEAAK